MEWLLIRHAPTAWNEAGRIQGRADPPLSPAGRALARSWQLPPPWDRAPVITSPLRRATETARLLGAGDARVEPRLIEMDWGAFEGRTLAGLRRRDPAGMAANEARGLDFRPPGGESPRDVTDRVRALFGPSAELDERCVAVTHKGVIRAAQSLATGWTMAAPPPVRLEIGEALALDVAEGGVVRLGRPPVVALVGARP